MLKKALSVLCAALICIGALCSCAAKREETIKVNDKEYSAKETVLTIGKYDVSLDFFRYCFLTVKNALQSENADIDFTSEENKKLLKEEVLGQTKYMFSVLELAEKYGYSLSAEELNEIDSTMEDTFNSAGSAADYRALLEENNLSQDVYSKALEINALSSKMAETLCGTDKDANKILFTAQEAVKKYSENNAHLMNIYFPVEYLDEQQNMLSEEEYAKNKADAEKKANAALKEIKGGASFADTMKKYMGDDAYEADLQSYYDLESISKSLGYDLTTLEIGQTSEVVFAQSCYYIIHRLESDTEYLTKNYETVCSLYAEEVYSEEIDKMSDSFEVIETELYKEIVYNSFGK